MRVDKNINKKSSATKIFIISVLVVIITFVTAKYATDEEFRNLVDVNILRKEVFEEGLNKIEINTDTSTNVYAYDKYITVLNKNKLSEYTADGKVVSELNVNISIPIVSTNGKYMVLAEKDGQKIYLISGNNILWDNTIEGNISKVDVNENGYVSVIMKNATYKSVIIFYDLNGKELFRRFLSSNYAVCTATSRNNKYLAIGEVDYSSTIIKSYVRIISIESAQKDPDNSIIYTYESDNGKIVIDINYKDKDTVMCLFDGYVQKITTDSNERFYDITENDLFIDINLRDAVAIIDKQSSGLFSYEYEINIKGVNSKSENLYILGSDLPETMNITGNNIALNLGNEVQIVNSNGWLLKKYNSNNQIKDIVIGDSIAGVIYKNKVEIIGL